MKFEFIKSLAQDGKNNHQYLVGSSELVVGSELVIACVNIMCSHDYMIVISY